MKRIAVFAVLFFAGFLPAQTQQQAMRVRMLATSKFALTQAMFADTVAAGEAVRQQLETALQALADAPLTCNLTQEVKDMLAAGLDEQLTTVKDAVMLAGGDRDYEANKLFLGNQAMQAGDWATAIRQYSNLIDDFYNGFSEDNATAEYDITQLRASIGDLYNILDSSP